MGCHNESQQYRVLVLPTDIRLSFKSLTGTIPLAYIRPAVNDATVAEAFVPSKLVSFDPYLKVMKQRSLEYLLLATHPVGRLFAFETNVGLA
jgi:hypothetical protein